MEQYLPSYQLPKAFWIDSPTGRIESSLIQTTVPVYSYQPTEAELVHEWLKPYGIRCDCCRRGRESVPVPSKPKNPPRKENYMDLLDKIIKETILECEEEEKLAQEQCKALQEIKEAVAKESTLKARTVQKVQKEVVKRKCVPESEPKGATKKPKREKNSAVFLGTPSNLCSTIDIQADLVRLAEEQSRSWAAAHNNHYLSESPSIY